MSVANDPIYVTRPFLPPLEEYVALLREIWHTRILSNSGPFHQSLERRLTDYLGAGALSLTANGALALEIAIDAAKLAGDVITTPYSFVATTHSVRRSQLRPVFVDINPFDLNIDINRIEAAITPRTSAIVAVHCYGNPCAVVEIERLATQYGLMVIYDASHAFGVRLNGRDILSWGDYATLSFHATKSYNTFEGGAVITRNIEAKAVVDTIKNFGITSETSIPLTGTNAKMSELNAALGHLQLDYYEVVRADRAKVDAYYRAALADIPGVRLLDIPEGVAANYSYFPILIGDEFPFSRDELYIQLKEQEIYSRRYFFPLLSNLPMYADEPSARPANLLVANDAAERVLCLPIYPDLTHQQLDRVVGAIRSCRKPAFRSQELARGVENGAQ